MEYIDWNTQIIYGFLPTETETSFTSIVLQEQASKKLERGKAHMIQMHLYNHV